MSNLEYWIWLASLPMLRPFMRRKLLEDYDVKELYHLNQSALQRVPGIRSEEVGALLDRDLSTASRVVDRCGELDVDIIAMQDALFPERLRNIPDPPCVLYVKGRLPALDAEPVITIVGTRDCTPYGTKMARTIAYEIASMGGIVATGLAGGIDSRAAEGALMADGVVVGVLGVAINHIYPSYNERLYADVSARGALVSEYPPDAKGSLGWFPQRNRIMAAFCNAAVVVEAPEKSGALITAHRAAEYGRDVFAVPGNTDALKSRGCNNLLREGASIAENGWDVMSQLEMRFPDRICRSKAHGIPPEMAIPEGNVKNAPDGSSGELSGLPASTPRQEQEGNRIWRRRVKNAEEEKPTQEKLADQLANLTETQLRIISVMTKPGMHVDDIVDLSRLPAATVLSNLTMLQVRGYVSMEAGRRFSLNIAK